jgi:hypothetical protein
MRIPVLIFRFLLLYCYSHVGANKPCEFDFKVYIYDLPKELNAVKYAEEARINGTYHVCAGCIFVSWSACDHFVLIVHRNNFHLSLW